MEWYVDTVIKCIIAHATTNRMILFCLIAANGCGMIYLSERGKINGGKTGYDTGRTKASSN